MKFGKNRIIVAGSRGFYNYEIVKKVLDLVLVNLPKTIDVLEIVSGYCPNSADMLGEKYAREVLKFRLGYGIRRFPAQWNVYDKVAGFIRNEEMALYSTHCVCFYDGSSLGTKNMIEMAKKYGLKLRIIEIEVKGVK